MTQLPVLKDKFIDEEYLVSFFFFNLFYRDMLNSENGVLQCAEFDRTTMQIGTSKRIYNIKVFKLY